MKSEDGLVRIMFVSGGCVSNSVFGDHMSFTSVENSTVTVRVSVKDRQAA